MHEVKVYDRSGKLKKIISVKALTRRSDRQINSPSSYIKKGRKTKPPAKVLGKDAKPVRAR